MKYLSLLVLMSGCATHPLPHRQEAETKAFQQGWSSQLDCAGQQIVRVDIDDQSYFLECR